MGSLPSTTYRNGMIALLIIAPISLSVIIVLAANPVTNNTYCALLGIWVFAAILLWGLYVSRPERLVRVLRPVNGLVASLNVRKPMAVPHALIDFFLDGKSYRGVVRMSDIPENTRVGARLQLWVHPRMLRSEWPELVYSPALDLLATATLRL